uniref:Uncharacterized protein n=1 Tax=Oryza nivara TaxID=4536 RepID=A0A0E0FLU5_ORYNI
MGRKNSVTSSAPTPSPNADEVQQEMAVGRSASARIRDRASRSLLGQEPYMTILIANAEDSSVGAGSKEYVHTLIQCGTTEEKD